MKFSVKIILFVAALSVLVSAKVAPVESALRSVTSKENCNVANVKIFENVVEVKRSDQMTIRAINISPAQSEILKIAGLFFLWYAFNAGYNVFNQYLKQDLQYPMTNAALQLVVGMLYAVPLWVLKMKKLPNLTKDDFLKLFPVVVLNTIGHTVTMIAMFEKGGGSFTHVIKAAEPVVTVLLNFLVCKLLPKPWTAFSLLPVTYGVAYASTLGNLNVATMGKEFTTTAAKMAMLSNFAFSMRSIVRKGLTKEYKARTNLDPSNEHALTTLLSFVLLLPVALLVEKPAATLKTFHALANPAAFLFNLFVCGMCYFLYNDVQNVVLGQLGPVPTAVGNTLKRVAIFAALYVFIPGETFPPAKVLGSAIAIAGCLAYAVCDSKKI